MSLHSIDSRGREITLCAVLLNLFRIYGSLQTVRLGHDVEEERIGVVVERLVVEEELRQQAQVLRVRLVLPPVDLATVCFMKGFPDRADKV